MDNREWDNKKILVVGFGRSGIAAARELLRLGASVTVQDSKQEEQIDAELLKEFKELGAAFLLGSAPEDVSGYDMVVLSPGVSPELGFVQAAAEAGAEITGELEIAYRLGKGNYIAITGTNGKTTTTTLTGEIFEKSGRKTHVAGNIGVAVITTGAQATEEDWMVTECSSFQLETTRDFHPRVSAILNLTPDHLNRHHTMEGYGAAKAKIFANQTEDDFLIINRDDPVCYALAENCRACIIPFSLTLQPKPGAYVRNGMITVCNLEGEEIPIVGADEMKIIGRHNLANALASAAICYFSGIDPSVIAQGIREFGGVEHRIEFCGEIRGVRYFNDSKGTNTDAAETALAALEKNVILIAGGDAKSQNFDEFVKNLPGCVKHLILLGRDAHFIAESCDLIGYRDYEYCKDMEECVAAAAKIAEPGDAVLLSPACASWDMYDNYEQRGRHFKACVRELM